MKKFLKNIYKDLINIFSNIQKDHVTEYVAQCSYYTILSFIPFLMLLITLIQYTNIEQEALFNVISKIFPSNMNEMILGIVREVYSRSIGTISLSIIFTIWPAGNGLYALIKGLNSAYGIKDKKSNSLLYLKGRSMVQTIIFIVVITIGLSLLVFGNGLIHSKSYLGILNKINFASKLLTQMILLVLTFGIYLVIYKFMPKHKVKMKNQVVGAAFGAISLNVTSYVFSKFLDIFKGFSITYGSLTTLMLVMMWTYACFYTILFGAEVNKYIKSKKQPN